MATPKRLAGPGLLTNAAVTKYTAPSYVPNTMVTVIRKIHCANVLGASHTVTISIGADAAGTEIATAKVVPANDFIDIWGPFTLAAGEVVQALADANSAINFTMDGYENDGP